MRHSLVAAIIALALAASPAFAHRLDEYLQATTISVEKDRLTLQMHLTPGVAVFDKVFAAMDTNGDGILSEAEQKAYAQQVLRDLSITIDRKDARPGLVSSTFPPIEDMKGGLGEIVLTFQVAVPPGGSSRRLTLENHHRKELSVYLVNSLVPRDANIHIAAQSRNYDQSFYQLDYTDTAGLAPPPAVAGSGEWFGTGWLARSGSPSLFKAYVYQGIHHILTGYDHLLFVSALVLAATTLWDVVRVVFTFTLAHSITLTLAALNVIHLPERVVEPMIAGSIVFIAIQNVFWPRRASGWTRLGAAFFFGLFHGLGFAGGLLDAMREMPGTTMLLAILAFSIGVEAGHQMVVLPLFALLKAARRTQSDAVARTHLSIVFQRIGSAGISVAGLYYLCLAVTGNS